HRRTPGLRSARRQVSWSPLQAFHNNSEQLVGQSDLFKNLLDIRASYLFVITWDRHHEHTAKVDRCGADSELFRVVDTRPVLSARKDQDSPGIGGKPGGDIDHGLGCRRRRPRKYGNQRFQPCDQRIDVPAAKRKDSRDIAIQSVVLDGEHFPRAGLKMKVVRSRSPALRPVVNDEEIRQRLRELQKSSKLPRDPLWPMIGVNDRQMLLEYGKWIAIERELRIEGNALLLGIEICRTQKAFPLRDGHCVDRSRRALDAMRDVTDQNLASENTLGAHAAFAQSFQASCKRGPLHRLRRDQAIN